MKRNPKTISLTDLGRKIGRNPSSISRQLAAAGVNPISRGEYPLAESERVMREALSRDANATVSDSGTPAYKYKMLQCKRLLQEIQKAERKTVDIDEHMAVPFRIAEIVRDVLYQMVSQTKLTTLDMECVRLQEKARDDAFNKINQLLRAEGMNEVPAANP